MKVAIVSNKNKEHFPNLLRQIDPVFFFHSTFDNYQKFFADLTLQVEKEIFLQCADIDLIFFAQEDSLDFDQFQKIVNNPWCLENSIFFTKILSKKQKSILLWNKDYIQIVTGNFFCKPEIFCYLHILYKIPMDDIAQKIQEFEKNLPMTYDLQYYLHLCHTAAILNININHLYYDR